MKYAANTKRIFSFIFSAVRNFVIKRTESVLAIGDGALGEISGQVTKNFGQRVFWQVH